MSDEIGEIQRIVNGEDKVMLSARVVLEYARPNPKKGTIDVLLHTTYTLDRMKRLAEATMNADGAALVLTFMPRQPELFGPDAPEPAERQLDIRGGQGS